MTDNMGAFMDANAGLHRKIDSLALLLSLQGVLLGLGVILGAMYLHKRGVK